MVSAKAMRVRHPLEKQLLQQQQVSPFLRRKFVLCKLILMMKMATRQRNVVAITRSGSVLRNISVTVLKVRPSLLSLSPSPVLSVSPPPFLSSHPQGPPASNDDAIMESCLRHSRWIPRGPDEVLGVSVYLCG